MALVLRKDVDNSHLRVCFFVSSRGRAVFVQVAQSAWVWVTGTLATGAAVLQFAGHGEGGRAAPGAAPRDGSEPAPGQLFDVVWFTGLVFLFRYQNGQSVLKGTEKQFPKQKATTK